MVAEALLHSARCAPQCAFQMPHRGCPMTLRRDHVVSGVLLALAGIALALSTDLPVGTLGSPGPGMLPYIAIGLIVAFSIALLVGAHRSPSFASIEWSELPHAASVTIAAAIATAAYTWLGFLITMSVLIFGVLVLVERKAVLPATAYALGIVLGAKLLLGTALKSQLPLGPFGF